jgi:hypothetical protein
MPFEFWPAMWAGIVGGIVMVLMSMTMKAAGAPMDMNIIRMWGTMLKLRGGAMQAAGWMMHLIASAVIALIYAWGFDVLGVEDNLWLWGLIGGVIHWFLGGLFLMMVPPMHPEIPEQRPAPGAFAKNFGMVDVMGFLMGHLVYGLLVGILYAYWHSAGGTNAAF